MSYMGTGSFGSYDKTVQTSGASAAAAALAPDASHEELRRTVESPSTGRATEMFEKEHHPDVTGTRATSVTEVADTEALRHYKETTPGGETDTVSEADAAEQDAIEDARRESLVQALARKITNQSTATVPHGISIFDAASDEDSP